MIAAFLKNADGEFDYPVLMLGSFFAFCCWGVAWELRRAWKTGRIFCCFTFEYADPVEFYVQRETNPFKFWLVFALYCLGILLIGLLCFAFCFGLLRKPQT
jgi:hypothetical protein